MYYSANFPSLLRVTSLNYKPSVVKCRQWYSTAGDMLGSHVVDPVCAVCDALMSNVSYVSVNIFTYSL